MFEPTDRRHQPVLEGSRDPTSIAAKTDADAAVSEALKGPGDWLQRARLSYTSSTNWFDSSIRKQVEKNLSHFRNKHSSGSKYHTAFYDKRSKFFRPKTRSMIRRGEAAMAIAYFSTADVVNCSAVNPADPDQLDGAEVHNALLNYRLQEGSRWFKVCIGGAQDAKVTGTVISRQYWAYETIKEPVAELYELGDGSFEIDIAYEDRVVRDEPRVDLVPLENLRLDPAADWIDPIGTSPYLIELVPMYVYEIKERMKKINPRTGRSEYTKYDNGIIGFAIKQDWDSIRKMREGERVDKYEADCYVDEYQSVWVHRNIMRVNGKDWYYETLGTEIVLSEPEPLLEVFPHLKWGERPYTMGQAVLETHKLYTSAPAELVESVQEELNDLTNLRMDNVRLTLLRRWFIRRGAGVDIQTLIRNVPASTVMMSDVNNDVKEVTTPDVTRGSFEEQDRLNLEFDEVGGNFSAASIGSNRQMNETVGGMNLLSGDASQIQEYEIRVISETWVEPTMRQLVQLEAYYESDEAVLNMVASRTGLPLERILQVMRKPVQVRANVGFNSTSPEKRINKLALALGTVLKFLPQAANGMNQQEVIKEVFAAVGFRDGARFFPDGSGGEDPQVTALKQQLAALEQIIATEQHKQQGRIEVAKITAQAGLQKAQIAAAVQYELGALKARIDDKRIQLEAMDRQLALEDADVKRRELYLQREALSHSIQQDNREFILKLQEVANATAEGAMNLPGNDKAGVISRNKYGKVPQAAG